MSDPAEAVVGVEAAKACAAEVPVIVTYAFQKTAPGEFRTMMGTSVAEAVRGGRRCRERKSSAPTAAPTLSLDDYVELAAQLVAAAGTAIVIVQPNAGSPRIDNGRTVYDATPEQMAATATRLLAAGVRVIGGCCGTTPGHLAAMSRALRV